MFTNIPSREQCKKNFISNCERIRYEKDLTQKEMADILDMSLNTYRNMILGDVDKISGYTTLRLSRYTGISMEKLLGDVSDTLPYLTMFENLSKQQKRHVQAVIEFEKSCMVDLGKGKIEIPLIVANSEFFEGFDFDTLSYYKYEMPLSLYNQHDNELVCAIEMPNSFYAPTFVKGDVLLIGRNRQPRDNEIGVFVHKGEVHIRKVYMGEKVVLKSIRQGVPPVEVDAKAFNKEWYCFGYVIKKMA